VSEQTLRPGDRELRRAITREPSAGLAALVFAEIAGELDRVPQVRRWRVTWPLSNPLPAIGPAGGRRHLGSLALVAIAILALFAGIAVVGLVGTLRAPPPFGLARPGLIAYDSEGQIFVADADGSSSRAITTGPEVAIEPTWSPNGTRLAWFSLDAATSKVQLVVADADGSQAHPVAELGAEDRSGGPTVGFLRIAWAPDGRRIAYAAPVDGRAQLFVVGLDRSPPVALGPADLEGHDPSWSPDGRRIAFMGGRFDEERAVYVVDSEGAGSPVRITPAGRSALVPGQAFAMPAWSPDGRWIAYATVVADADESHVFVVPSEGGEARDLSGPGTNDWTPTWSPDGSWLAWRFGRYEGPGQFVVARPDGSQRSVLPPIVLGPPVWSPDGRSLIGVRPNESTGFTDGVLRIGIERGETIAIPAQPAGDASWQRLAP
jgi:Tol biopolymer transport system component